MLCNMSRPTKLTPETQREFLSALRSGCTRKDAARYVGVHPDSIYLWLKRGSEPEAEDPYREFFRLVNRAERSVKIRALGIIQQAQEGDWKAAAWWLERKHPEEFGRRDRLRVDGHTSVNAKVTLAEDVEIAMTDESTREMLDALSLRMYAVRAGTNGSANGNGSAGAHGARMEGEPGSNGS